jgi:fatty acid desaturase
MIIPEEKIKVEEWYTSEIPRIEFKGLLKRDDGHAFIYFGLWLALLVAVGAFACFLYPSALSIPVFLIYGVIYTGNNPRWHECSHGTPFKTGWLNEFFYWLCGSMELRDMVDFRWSHSRHHSFTIQKEVDPEIPAQRPPNLWAFFLDFFYLWNGPLALKNLILHSLGIVSKKAEAYVPKDEYQRMFWSARAALLPHIVAIGLAIGFKSWLPVLLFGLPRFYGGFLIWTFIVLQHAGLEENVWDHRRNCRSFTLDPLTSFLFMNMENHIEHHMYPLVPFHALPALNKRIQDQLPKPYNGLLGALRELIVVLFKQRKDFGATIRRILPEMD